MEGESRGWRSVNDDDSFIGQAFCFTVKTPGVNDSKESKGGTRSRHWGRKSVKRFRGSNWNNTR